MICLSQVSPLDLAAPLHVPGLPDALAPVLPSVLALLPAPPTLAPLGRVHVVAVA